MNFELRVIEENNYLIFGEYFNDIPCSDIINKLNLDDLEYVKKLQQENQQLKLEIREEKLNYARLQNTLIESNEDRIKIQSVLDEIRDYVIKIRDDYNNRSLEEKNLWIYEAYIHGVSNLVEILSIIDKVGDSNE